MGRWLLPSLPRINNPPPPPGGDGTSDHGQLDGLADDDHTQYAKADGSRGDFEVAGAAATAQAAAVATAAAALADHEGAEDPHPQYLTSVPEPDIYTLVATLANDATTGANTTPIDLTDLVFTYETNSVYRIWFCGRVSAAAATTGCGFQINVSSAVTSVDLIFFHQLANTGTLSGGHSIADDASQGVSSGIPANGGNYTVSGHGLLRTTTNTGTAQLRYRSETNAATTARAGLTMVVEKVA